MDKKIKAKWLRALRSGEYGQVRGRLCRTSDGGKTIDGFCCLGLLAHVADPRPWKYDKIHGLMTLEGHAGRLPSDFRRRIKLEDYAMEVLIDFNDKARWSFKRIADWIEKNL